MLRDFLFELVEHGAGELFYPAASKTSQVNVFASGFHFVIMLFALQMHQVQFVDQPMLLEQFEGPVHGGAIDIREASLGDFQQGSGIHMPIGLLNNFNENAALLGQANAFGSEFI